MRYRQSKIGVAGMMLSALALFACSPSDAQTAAPSSWQEAAQQPTPGLTVYTHKQLGDGAMLMSTEAITPDRMGAMVASLETVCQGISSANGRDVLGGKLKLFSSAQGAAHCAVGFYQQGGNWRSVVVMKSPNASLSADEAAQQWAAQYIDGGAAQQAGATAANSGGAQGSAAASGGSLAQVLAAVPQANRPIAIVLRRQWKSTGMTGYTTYLPWMVFANGYATDDDCYDWDPGTTTPTPQGIAAAGQDCDVVRWRKSGNVYQFQDDDGTWEDPEYESPVYPFTRGKTLDVTMENIGGAGGAPSIPGGVGVNSVWGGSLRMTSGGEIAIGDWSGAVVSGGGVGGGSGRESAITGRYYIDGFLIAIKGSDGRVSRGFIAGADTNGKFAHIYLNGEQYWFGK